MQTQLKTQYKSAEACYLISGAPHAPVVTLLHYAGPAHHRPPARILVMAAGSGTFTHDVCAPHHARLSTHAVNDPLFPPKQERNFYGDHVV